MRFWTLEGKWENRVTVFRCCLIYCLCVAQLSITLTFTSLYYSYFHFSLLLLLSLLSITLTLTSLYYSYFHFSLLLLLSLLSITFTFTSHTTTQLFDHLPAVSWLMGTGLSRLPHVDVAVNVTIPSTTTRAMLSQWIQVNGGAHAML